ncbi:MAG: site-specific integrase [Acidimicrobiales bacterium]|nr:site-specific integrase [Acidimicrobiales bacterium]
MRAAWPAAGAGNGLPDPLSNTELPTWALDERDEQVHAPAADDVAALLEAARGFDERLAAFLRVLVATGMRRGEGCALRWSDIGWNAGTVRVDEAVVAADGGAVVRQPKTRASIRTLAIDAGTLVQSRELEAMQLQLATSCGMVVGPQGFVFSYEPGGALPPIRTP